MKPFKARQFNLVHPDHPLPNLPISLFKTLASNYKKMYPDCELAVFTPFGVPTVYVVKPL